MAGSERTRTDLVPPPGDELQRQLAAALRPSTPDDLQRRRRAYEQTLRLRERGQPPGVTVDELLRQVREDDAS